MAKTKIVIDDWKFKIFGSRLNSGSAGLLVSSQSSHVIHKNQNIEINLYKTIILPLVLCGSLTLRK